MFKYDIKKKVLISLNIPFCACMGRCFKYATLFFNFSSLFINTFSTVIHNRIYTFVFKYKKNMRKLKITELNRLSPEEFKNSDKNPLIVILDNIRSLHNVGSVFRTADAFKVEAVYLCGITACPPHAEIHKTALGAEDTVDWLYFKDTLQVVDKLKKEGYTVCAVEQAEGSVMLDKFQRDSEKKYAVILGNEVKGVQQTVVDNCDLCIEIPQYGTKHSLNVSVTAGIIVWQLISTPSAP